MEQGHNYWYKEKDKIGEIDLLELASIQRSITNFVKILTGENIPVSYPIMVTTSRKKTTKAKTEESSTDGKSITIGSHINSSNIDSVVGLALHEASHCLLSDYDVFKTIINRCLEEKITLSQHINIVKDLLNWVEDRRIDYFVYNTSPGYKVYYHACYDRFFNSEDVDKTLKDKTLLIESWDSYMLRIINIFNKNINLNDLKHLKEIYEIIDLKNIDRLTTTFDSLEVAIKIFNLLKVNLPDPEEEKLKDNQLKNLRINITTQKQKQFLRGNSNKKPISLSNWKKVNELSKAKISYTKLNSKEFSGSKRVIVLEDIKKELVNIKAFNIFNQHPSLPHIKAVDEGIILGKVLTSKLKIRNEQRITDLKRLKGGKIDSKRIYAANFLDDIFKKTLVTSLKPVKLHISVDASGSMKGEKWNKTIKLVSALSYASLKIPNFDVVVSFRTTDKTVPITLLAFDSEKHKINSIYLFKQIACNGATPEGLCIESILNKIPNTTYKVDSYFLNLSDGMPTFVPFGYEKDFAINHTRDIMKILKQKGVNILSYYISDLVHNGYHNNCSQDNFKEMYGKESSFIDVSSLNQVTTTLNKLFLK